MAMENGKDLVLFDQQSINAIELFMSHEKLNKTLEGLREKVLSFVPDVSTATGRKNIASLRYKVAQSKTWMIGEGKKLTIEWRENTKKVNEECNFIESFCNDLADKAREPITLWEIAEATRVKAEDEAAQYAADWDAALSENETFDLKAEVARFKAEQERIEAERLAREEVDRQEAARKQAEIDRLETEKKAEAERVEREKRIAQEAKEAAERAAEEARVKAEKDALAKLESERIAAAERIAAERIEAQRKADEAELKRLADIKAAEDKAEAEKQAIIRAQQEKDRKEAERVERERIAEEKRQSNIKHRNKIKDGVKMAFMKEIGCPEDKAILIVKIIDSGAIPNVTINF